jgi:diguanylate cyclase (GGDEF)-like protein/PAS domain S-box-containing protein
MKARRNGHWQLPEDSLRQILDTLPNAVLVKDRDHRWILVNQTLCREFGRTPAELLYGTAADFLPAEQAARFDAADDAVFATGEPREIETQIRDSLARTRKVLLRKRLLQLSDSDGTMFPAVVTVVVDVTAYREAEARAQYLAMHDALTGMPNRQSFGQRLEQAIVESRAKCCRFAVLLLDIDGFKLINDRFGHAAGDVVLRVAGERLTQSVREVDTAARLGGDEFAILQRADDQPLAATRLAGRIAATLAEPMAVMGHSANVSASIGIAVFRDHSEDAADLLQKADQALYAVKYAGKARSAVYRPELPGRVR